MEPRVNVSWVPLLRYLGGTADHDLFLDADGDVRYVPIHGNPSDWGYFEIRDGKLLKTIAEEDLTYEQKQAALHYIWLFAPGILMEKPCPTDG